MAQSNLNQALEVLLKDGLISAKEEMALKLQEKKISDYRRKKGNNVSYKEKTDYTIGYEMLALAIKAKQFSTLGTRHAFSFTPAARASREMSDEAIFNEIKTFIGKLQLSGLASSTTIAELNNKNEKHRFAWVLEAAQYAFVKTNEEYFLLPGHFTKFINGLLAADVIDKAGYNLLQAKSASGQLHNYSEICPFLKRCVIIDLKKLPENDEQFLRELYEKTSVVIPGLKFDSFSRKDVIDKKESFDDFISHNLFVTLQAGNKKYSYSSFYDYENCRKDTGNAAKSPDETEYKIPDQYYQVFNKMMADQQSPYKLHKLSISHDSFGIIALTEKQTKSMEWTYDGAVNGYVNISYENYSRKITGKQIEEAINVYDSLGLFKHLTVQQKDSCIEEVSTKEINYYSDILKTFANTVIDIDSEYGIDSGQYKEITQQFANYSRGHFKPEDLTNTYTFENKRFNYGFTLNGQKYKVTLKQEDDWLDMRFWDLIQSAIKEQDINGNFYYVYPSDGLTVIYLTQQQYAILKDKKLLEFSNKETLEKGE